jgi:capsular polysaccharide export protein
MASIGAGIGSSIDNWAERLIRRKGLHAAQTVLFPELGRGFGNRPAARLAEGILRAPRRGWSAPPVLSAWVAGLDARSAPCPGLTTIARSLHRQGWEDPGLLARAAAVRQALVAARVGGRWWAPGAEPQIKQGRLAVVALAEPSLADGAAERTASPETAAAMLDMALSDFPADRVVALAPLRSVGRLRSPIDAARARGIAVIARACDPWPLLDRADRVYSIGGEVGFLALLADVPVTAFAAAAYTGWGMTRDHEAVPQHGFRRSVEEIFAGLCLVATRYRDPFHNTATGFEEALAILAEWRRLEMANRRIAVCVGMSFWKRRRIADFLRSSAGAPVFSRTVAGALAAARARRSAGSDDGGGAGDDDDDGERGTIAGWASRLPEGLAEAAARDGVPLIRVEDGFIRSVGLGSDFLPPASLVFDTRGMYFDPRGGSDLENLLRDSAFSPDLLARAARLGRRLVERGITKYNLASGGPIAGIPADRQGECREDRREDRRCILVPGQVEDDLSIRFGAGLVRTNLGLLARVRAANQHAFIIYKPHPDVVAGHRIGAVPDGEACRFADLVVANGSTDRLLSVCHEVHTMTSLAGFEALLRGLRVVVYGRPFYAGWGLTTDLPPFDRGRVLSLDQLVAGALILYPRYLDPLTLLPCGPEILIERLEQPELWRAGPLVRARRLQGSASRRLAGLRTTASPAAGDARGLPERSRN